MTQFSCPELEHRHHPTTPSEVLADELRTYKTPEEFATFLKYLHRSYGKTALAKVLLDQSRLMVSAGRLLRDEEDISMGKENSAFYGGSLVGAFTHTRVMRPGKQAAILLFYESGDVTRSENETNQSYKNRRAAHYLDLHESVDKKIETIYEDGQQEAITLDRIGELISGVPALGHEYAYAAEAGYVYGGLVVANREAFFDQHYPDDYYPRHFSM